MLAFCSALISSSCPEGICTAAVFIWRWQVWYYRILSVQKSVFCRFLLWLCFLCPKICACSRDLRLFRRSLGTDGGPQELSFACIGRCARPQDRFAPRPHPVHTARRTRPRSQVRAAELCTVGVGPNGAGGGRGRRTCASVAPMPSHRSTPAPRRGRCRLDSRVPSSSAGWQRVFCRGGRGRRWRSGSSVGGAAAVAAGSDGATATRAPRRAKVAMAARRRRRGAPCAVGRRGRRRIGRRRHGGVGGDSD
jgi:hypothetical protein